MSVNFFIKSPCPGDPSCLIGLGDESDGSPVLLFVTQCVDRVELGGAVGGVIAEERADHGSRAECQQDGGGLDDGAHVTEQSEDVRASHPDQHADQAADNAEQQRLGQELQSDVIGGRTDCLSDADLAACVR